MGFQASLTGRNLAYIKMVQAGEECTEAFDVFGNIGGINTLGVVIDTCGGGCDLWKKDHHHERCHVLALRGYHKELGMEYHTSFHASILG